MGNFTDPIKAGFGRFLYRFYANSLVGNTPTLAEFAARGFSKSAVWAPGRMIDQVEEMLAAWRKNDTSGADQPTPFLPIIIAAMGKDYFPAPPEFSRLVADPMYVSLPDDPKRRVFKMRAVVADVRTQVAIIAADGPTAHSIALQLHAFFSATENRIFYASFKLAGLDENWPVVLELPDIQAVNTPTEQKNLTILTVDVQTRATIPLLLKPKAGEASDGKGAHTEDDPDGYLVVVEANGANSPAPGYQYPSNWTETV